MKTDLYVATLATSVARLYRIHPHHRLGITAILKTCIRQANANARADKAAKAALKATCSCKKRHKLTGFAQK